MIQSTISELPWQVVGTDLFQWLGSNYVLVVDYMSRFVEVAKLENSTSSMVIHHIKSFFSRHGIPREVRSDNGPCYSSAELKIKKNPKTGDLYIQHLHHTCAI